MRALSREDFTFDADRHVYVCPVDFLMDDITGYNDARSNSGMRRPQRLVRFTLTSRHLRARCAERRADCRKRTRPMAREKYVGSD